MGSNDRAIQDQVLHIRVIGKMLMHIFPDAMVAPACKTLVDAIPVAVLFRQQAPLGSAAGDPQHSFQVKTAVGLLASIGAWVALQVRIDFVPLIFTESYS
jgi:hypothetical protein